MGSSLPQIMDFTTLRAVVNDLDGRILPSRFEKAQQSDPQTLQLGFRTLKGMVWLELSWWAECPRLVQIPPPPRDGAGSTLAQQFQHGLRHLALVEMAQAGFERVVTFSFASRPGDPVQRTLVLELMGRHSNVLLLDEAQRVIALGRQVRDHQSRVRPIGTGDRYVPPPPLQSIPPERSESFERWQKRLSLVPVTLAKALPQTYQGISPALARQLTANQTDSATDLLNTSVQDLNDRQWRDLYCQWQQWLTCLEQGQFSFIPADTNTNSYRVWQRNTSADSLDDPSPAPPSRAGDPLSLSLGRFYSAQLQNRALTQQSEELRQQLKQAKQREESQLEDQLSKLKATEQAPELQQQADALLCLQSPNRDQIDQAQKLYRRAKKLRRAVPLLEERQRHHRQRLELIDGTEAFLEDVLNADWDQSEHRLQRLSDLRLEAQELLVPRQRGSKRQGLQRKQGQPQPLELQSPSGLSIQVGRNHRQNDWISLRQAKPGDLWFHAQECPGSHVVLKASAGPADDDDLSLAADLAALFSRARGNRRVAVVVVPVEQLQRIVGAGPGTVRHKGGTVRWAEPERAERQLQSGKLLA